MVAQHRRSIPAEPYPRDWFLMLLFILNTHKEGKKSDSGRGGKEHLGISHCIRRGIGSLMCHSGPWRDTCGAGGGGDLFSEG